MSENTLSPAPVEENPALVNQDIPLGILTNTKIMNNLYRLARTFANSAIVPAAYHGNPDNCFVAIELANRMNVSPSLVMQNLYVVQGRPSWSGQACIALINGCGLFERPLDFVFVGEPGALSYGCYATTARKGAGEVLRGTTITMQMARDEGWLGKNGSKWKTMPDQMLCYRAATFFARLYCPNVLMGFSTVEEQQDIAPQQLEPEKIKITK